MDSLLKDFYLENGKPSEEALVRWRSLVSIVKNPRRRFRHVEDLAKRAAAEREKRNIQIVGSPEIGDSYPNSEIEETLSTRQNNHSQQIVRSLEIESYRIEPDNSNFDHRTRDMTRNGRRRKVSLEWIFAISNFILELPSVVLDQLSSAHKPQYALFAMLISFAALFICMTELIYKGRKEKVVFKWRGRLPWFYNASQNYKPFGTFKDTVGSICALCQCVSTTVNYAQADTIKISVWPVVFAFGLLGSKMLENPERSTAV